MIRKMIFLLTGWLLLLPACEDSSPSSNNQGLQVPEASTETGTDWLIVPGERVGKIKGTFTEADIIAAYGEDQVKRLDVGTGAGEMRTATIVFPNTNNELSILWKSGLAKETMDEIRINGEGTSWKTAQGITNGSRLNELLAANGKDFSFFGFEWEYAGVVNDWNGGKLDQRFMVFLVPENPEAVFPELLGDDPFPANHPKAAAADLRVNSMVVKFNTTVE